MSVQAMSWVIDHAPQKGGALVCLLMIANHAHADGAGAYPSTATLAKECRMSQRQVTRLIKQLEDENAIKIERGAGPNGTHLMTVLMNDKAPAVTNASDKLSSDKMSGVTSRHLTNATQAPEKMSDKPSLRTVNRNNESATQTSETRASKPRTEKQRKSDELYERKRAVFEAYCRGMDMDPDSPAGKLEWDRSTRAIGKLLLSGVPLEDIEPVTRYARQQTWRDSPPSLGAVAQVYTGWVNQGRPATPMPDKPRASQNSNGRVFAGDLIADIRRREAMGER